jgi:hypothetical protein
MLATPHLFASNDNFLDHDLILADVLEKGRALGQQLVKSMNHAPSPPAIGRVIITTDQPTLLDFIEGNEAILAYRSVIVIAVYIDKVKIIIREYARFRFRKPRAYGRRPIAVPTDR